MAIWVTESGFNKKTLPEIKTELEGLFQEALGNDIDLSSEGVIGQIIGILSKREADLWDGAQEIYTSRNPNEATGTSLENIAAETRTRRLDATPTRVNDVYLYGDEGTVVSAGSKVRQDADKSKIYALDTEVTITKNSARYVRIKVDAPSGVGEDYTLTLNAIPYTYTTVGGDTETEVINGLRSLIAAGSWGGTTSNIDDAYIDLEDADTDFSIALTTANFTMEELASAGDFVCTIDGAFTLPAETLTVITTPVSGWDSVINFNAGDTGRDVETDSELRLRRVQSLALGKGTDEAIRSALLNSTEDVTAALVISNRTDDIDSDGRDPHSFEAIVEGGSDLAIGSTLWQTMPSGIATYGLESVAITDSQGNEQIMNFSRPSSVYIWVTVEREMYSEEEYPADGDLAIKNEIVSWSLAEYTLGKDVIRQRLNIPIYKVPGIGSINITVAKSTDPAVLIDPYTDEDIEISVRERASFATSRIIITDL